MLKRMALVCALLMPVCAVPTDLLAFDVAREFNKRFDDGIRSKSASMVWPVKDAFLEATKILFDEKLKPLIDQIDRAAAGRLDQFGQTIQDALQGIDAILTRAEAIATSAISDIKTKIIVETFTRADELMNRVTANVRSIVDEIDCKIDGQRERLYEWWASIASFPNPFNACYWKQGAIISAPRPHQYIRKFRIQECLQMAHINSSNTVGELVDSYGDMLLLVRRFSCIANDDQARRIIDREGGQYTREFNSWWLMLQ